MSRRRAIGTAVLLGSLMLPQEAPAQSPEPCTVLCAPELLIEPTWTIENLAQRPRVVGDDGPEMRLPRENVFELVLALDVPTRWRRFGLTIESIFAPASDDNEVEVELEFNIHLLLPERTHGWVSSHFDIVDQFGPAARPHNRAYAHRLDFELDTAVAVFKKAGSAFLRSLEIEGSLDYLASGLPRRGDVIDGMLYLEPASPWSFSVVLVIPLAPR
jgi:hypothetical protein